MVKLGDSETLDLFKARTEELVGTRLVASGALASNFNINFDRMKGVKFSISNPNEEDLRSFLLTLRQFVSDGEPVFVNRIHNQLWKALSAGSLRDQLAEARQHWKTQRSRGPMALILDGKTLTPEYVLDLWVNGYYFHNDSRKAQALRLLDPVGAVLVRHAFLDHLIEVTRYVIFLRNVITAGRREGILLI